MNELYRGPGLPDPDNGFKFVHTKFNVKLVIDSLKQILLTPIGARLFNPSFGCGIADLLFEPIDPPVQLLAKQLVTDAIRTWEPRVELQSVDVNVNENTLEIAIACMVIKIRQQINTVITIPLPS